MKRTMIIVAITEKYLGLCILAYDPKNKEICRLVPNESGNNNAIPYDYCVGENELEVGSIIEIKIIKQDSSRNSQENYIIDINECYNKKGIINREQIQEIIKYKKYDWILGSCGRIIEANRVTYQSIQIAEIKKAKIIVKIPKYIRNQDYCNVRLDFSYGGVDYKNFPVKDIEIFRKLQHKENTEIIIGDCTAIFSRTQKKRKNQYCKLVACILININELLEGV